LCEQLKPSHQEQKNVSDLKLEVLEQRIRDHQSRLAGLSVEYGDEQMALIKVAEQMAICEGELNALTGTLRERLEEQARARATTITREANEELQKTQEQIAGLAAELEAARTAANAAEAATAKKSTKAKKTGDKR
jgi:chromosome segregation ATPase